MKHTSPVKAWQTNSKLMTECAVGECFSVSKNVLVKKPELIPIITNISSECPTSQEGIP